MESPMHLRNLLAAAAVLALAPTVALAAQDGRFSATLGYGVLNSSNDSPVVSPAGTLYDHDNDDTVLSGSFTWHITDQWAVEAWTSQGATEKVEIDLENAPDIAVADFDVQPTSLMAQYHFTALHDRVTPFVGLGWHWTSVNGVSTNPAIDEAAGLKVDGDNGFAAVAGVDVALGKHWFVRGDLRYLDRDLASSTHHQPVARSSSATSMYYGASVGLRF
jgi:outer membrane protein W